MGDGLTPQGSVFRWAQKLHRKLSLHLLATDRPRKVPSSGGRESYTKNYLSTYWRRTDPARFRLQVGAKVTLKLISPPRACGLMRDRCVIFSWFASWAAYGWLRDLRVILVFVLSQKLCHLSKYRS